MSNLKEIEESFKKYEDTLNIEENIINNITLLKTIFKIPDDIVKLKIKIDGFAPRTSDKIVVWSLSEIYKVDIK
jgi:hypothetical protein